MKSVLIYGDSNTWSLIPGSDPAAQYPPEIRWTCRLQSMCPDVRFLTDGLCGRTIAHEDADRTNRNGLETLRALLETEPLPDAAIVMLGEIAVKRAARQRVRRRIAAGSVSGGTAHGYPHVVGLRRRTRLLSAPRLTGSRLGFLAGYCRVLHNVRQKRRFMSPEENAENLG